MTTDEAAARYLRDHLASLEGRGFFVFNPHSVDVVDLPAIYGFNNGGEGGFLGAVAMSEDGVVLGTHCCSSEGYMASDLGMLEGTRLDLHEGSYRVHYPDGYRMEFVPSGSIEGHVGLAAAFLAHSDATIAAATGLDRDEGGEG